MGKRKVEKKEDKKTGKKDFYKEDVPPPAKVEVSLELIAAQQQLIYDELQGTKAFLRIMDKTLTRLAETKLITVVDSLPTIPGTTKQKEPKPKHVSDDDKDDIWA